MKLTSVLGGISLFLIGSVLHADCKTLMEITASERPVSTKNLNWAQSLPLRPLSPVIGDIGGTEVRSLVGMDGKLYAGVGYWMDQSKADPALPGAQVLRLDSNLSQWKIDLELKDIVPSGPNSGMRKYLAISTLETATFTSDYLGKKLRQPVSVLLAGVWTRAGGLDVFSRTQDSKNWARTSLVPDSMAQPGNQIRSFTLHKDQLSGVETVFAGSNPFGIFSGQYDPAKPGGIRWSLNPEKWDIEPPHKQPGKVQKDRVMSFAENDGKLYATVYNSIYERQDGSSPVWKKVYEYFPQKAFDGSSGLRGLTSVPDPANAKKSVLIASYESNPLLILKIDPTNNFKGTIQLNASSFLSNIWGTPVGYGIAAYNKMVRYQDSQTGEHLLLMGIEVITPKAPNVYPVKRWNKTFKRFEYMNWNAGGFFLIRHYDGTYDFGNIAKYVTNGQIFESVRTMTPSPFPEDPSGTLFSGGFDANHFPVHNSAWIYKGTP